MSMCCGSSLLPQDADSDPENYKACDSTNSGTSTRFESRSC